MYDGDNGRSPDHHGPASGRFKGAGLGDRDTGVKTKEAVRFTESECVIGVDYPSCRSIFFGIVRLHAERNCAHRNIPGLPKVYHADQESQTRLRHKVFVFCAQ
jgi:hypothetical protein